MDSWSDIETDRSAVGEFFRDKIVFLTGATGVMGELFVQKMLSFNVKCVYILLRSKAKISDAERIAAIYSTPLYEPLRKRDPNYLSRVRIVNGDMSKLKLSICTEDLLMLNECVQIVVHAAANVRFDCPFEEIILTNVRGTREIIALAKSFRHLLSFAYISTAYCHSHRLNRSTKELFYTAPLDPDVAICMAEKFVANETDNALVNILTDKLICPWPNTYSFSKSISEELLRRSLSTLPVVVVRPSIVIATYSDPIAGYCTNYFGLNGFMASGGIGLSRSVFGSFSNVANIVCADFAVNGTLAIVWDQVVNRKAADPPVYTMNNGHSELTWGEVCRKASSSYTHMPWRKSLWAPRTNCTSSPLVALYFSLVYQMLPGLLFDAAFWATGREDRVIPVYRRVMGLITVVKFFFGTQFRFAVDNIQLVYSRMSAHDRKHLLVGAERLDLDEFMPRYTMGLRRYMAKESLETLPEAKKRLVLLLWAHRIVLIVYYLILGYINFWLLRRFTPLFNSAGHF